MDHRALVPARRQQRGNAGAIDKIEVGRAGVLVHAERQLELSDLHFGEAVLLVVHVDVAPRIVVVAELTFDLVVEDVQNLAVDADALAGDVGRRHAHVVAVDEFDVGALQIALQANAEVDARALAKMQGRAVVPAEPPVTIALLTLSLDLRALAIRAFLLGLLRWFLAFTRR